jgi:cytochrome P450
MQYSCIGEKFATMEIALLLREMLTRYDIAHACADPRAYYNPLFLRFTDNLPLHFTPRA